ncbi:hypothetical protein V1318_13290 [Lysobacter sp. CCNWLW3]|uniref:hypothetical protein n=1 Tax=unclassified Lysobacter TaxID=2635362 RepID=UPI002FD6D802
MERSQGELRFRFDAWDMPVASRRGAESVTEFIGAIPSPPPPLVAGRSASGRTLSLRDAQNEYVFVEAD